MGRHARVWVDTFVADARVTLASVRYTRLFAQVLGGMRSSLCVAPFAECKCCQSLLPVYTSKNYLSWDATAELGYCAQRHSASVLDDLLLQRQFPINQIVTDRKPLMLPEIVAGIVVCGHTDGDFWQADRTKRFNHTAH